MGPKRTSGRHSSAAIDAALDSLRRIDEAIGPRPWETAFSLEREIERASGFERQFDIARAVEQAAGGASRFEDAVRSAIGSQGWDSVDRKLDGLAQARSSWDACREALRVTSAESVRRLALESLLPSSTNAVQSSTESLVDAAISAIRVAGPVPEPDSMVAAASIAFSFGETLGDRAVRRFSEDYRSIWERVTQVDATLDHVQRTIAALASNAAFRAAPETVADGVFARWESSAAFFGLLEEVLSEPSVGTLGFEDIESSEEDDEYLQRFAERLTELLSKAISEGKLAAPPELLPKIAALLTLLIALAAFAVQVYGVKLQQDERDRSQRLSETSEERSQRQLAIAEEQLALSREQLEVEREQLRLQKERDARENAYAHGESRASCPPSVEAREGSTKQRAEAASSSDAGATPKRGKESGRSRTPGNKPRAQ